MENSDSSSSITIYDYLTQPNDEVDNANSVRGNNTTNKPGSIKPRRPRHWRDFHIQALRDSFGELLEYPMQAEDSTEIDKNLKQMFGENSINNLASARNVPMVSRALLSAHRICESIHLNRCWRFEKIIFGKNDRRGNIPGSHSRQKWEPDWCSYHESQIIRYQGDTFGYVNLLPGDSKSSTKWESAWRESDREREKTEWWKPITQVTTYCVYAGTRYGFILSQKELVPIRISMDTRKGRPATTSPSTASTALDTFRVDLESSFGSDSSKEIYFIEYCSIPWSNYGPGDIVNLALWWMNMLAGRDRSLGKRYRPLNGWRCLSDSEYEHRISGRKLKHLPQGGIVLNPRKKKRPRTDGDDQEQERVEQTDTVNEDNDQRRS
jgi:hypothetical protein